MVGLRHWSEITDEYTQIFTGISARYSQEYQPDIRRDTQIFTGISVYSKEEYQPYIHRNIRQMFT